MRINRYITALLVVLAATGMEAQTYQQALRFALSDISYDEFIQQPEAKAIEEDILCALKAIRQASCDEEPCGHQYLNAVLPSATSAILSAYQTLHVYPRITERKYCSPYGSIVIRGPDLRLLSAKDC